MAAGSSAPAARISGGPTESHADEQPFRSRTMSDSALAAHTSSHLVLHWPALVVALFLATDSARSTMTEYLVTPFARTAFLVGIGVAAIGWALILQKEGAYLRSACPALPYAEFRRHPPPVAGRLFGSLLFRWSVLFCLSRLTVENVLEIVESGPSAGSLAIYAALASAMTVLAARRGLLSHHGESDETPELAIEPNIALSHSVQNFGSLAFAWGIWVFVLLRLAAALLARPQ